MRRILKILILSSELYFEGSCGEVNVDDRFRLCSEGPFSGFFCVISCAFGYGRF